MSPLPTPNKSESEKEFISRCIADLTANEKEKFPTAKQRVAVCYTQFNKTKKNNATSLVELTVMLADEISKE